MQYFTAPVEQPNNISVVHRHEVDVGSFNRPNTIPGGLLNLS